jgi:flavoprotein
MSEVYMNIPEVERISQGFESAAEVLGEISQVMQRVSDVLKATAFIGAVGGAAVIYWLDTIQPVVQQLSDYCEEVHSDIDIAVQNFINGDTDAAGRFG